MHPKVDFFIGLFLVAFSVVAFFIAGELPEAKKGLGPGDYPQVVLSTLFVLGVIQVGYSFFLQRKKSHPRGRNMKRESCARSFS